MPSVLILCPSTVNFPTVNGLTIDRGSYSVGGLGIEAYLCIEAYLGIEAYLDIEAYQLNLHLAIRRSAPGFIQNCENKIP